MNPFLILFLYDYRVMLYQYKYQFKLNKAVNYRDGSESKVCSSSPVLPGVQTCPDRMLIVVQNFPRLTWLYILHYILQDKDLVGKIFKYIVDEVGKNHCPLLGKDRLFERNTVHYPGKIRI